MIPALRAPFDFVIRMCTGMAFALCMAATATAASVPRPDHVVVVMEENHWYAEIIGSAQAPYMNALAAQGALFTQAYALSHPSLPNYLQLFSGSNQGITGDSEPHAFTTPNLGAAVFAKGLSFVGYSEDLPGVGSLANYVGLYDRDHCPWVQWQAASANGIPASSNRPFSDFPTDFTTLPTVAFVTPNLQHIMHDSDGTIAEADTWLHDHLDAYAQWAKIHNSLLIVQWDESDGAEPSSEDNRVARIFVGAQVAVGQYAEHTDHYGLLRTIEDMYGLTHSGAAATAAPISDCWISGQNVAPMITAQPQNRSVTVGQTATFLVAATGTPSPIYQWQRNGSAISGETSASYTTAATVAGDDGAAFRVVVTNSAGSVTSATATLSVESASAGPLTPLHYAVGNNIATNGAYTPGAVGFNLADVSSVAALDALPAGVQGLVWIGLGAGTDANFIATITPYIGHPKLFGFYLMDEPDPTGQWAPLTTPAALKDESDWIHAHVAGAKTFIVLMDLGSFNAPSFMNSYTPTNTHIDLFGLDPYPCRTSLASPDYALIDRTVSAAVASGVPVSAIVPVYQTFGLGDWTDNLGGKYAMPTASEEQRILATWGALVPTPAFDFAYSWGSQRNDQSLEGSSALQAVFADHNRTTSTTPPSISAQPSNRSVTVGQTAIFTVTATGSPTLTYQWQRNGTDIPAAMAATYTTPPTVSADDGAIFRVVVSNSAGRVTSAVAMLTIHAAATQTPYGGTAWAIPGRIEAENFDDGGEGVAYHDRDIANQGGAYRNTGVDVYADPAAQSGKAVGWIEVGEWLEYSVHVASAGSYTLGARVASPGGGGAFHFEIDGTDISGALIVPDTTGWGIYSRITKAGVTLPSGDHILRVAFDRAGANGVCNLDYVEFTTVGPPPPVFSPADVGSVTPPGSVTSSGGTWTVQGAGADIWGRADACQFAAMPLNGDGEIVARVASQTNTDGWANAGVMIRESLAVGSRHALCAVTPAHGIIFVRRLATDGSSRSTAGSSVQAPYWLKLTRVGNQFTAAQSPDGVTWRQIASQTIAMSSTAFVGLAVTSHNDGVLSTAVFDHVTITAGPVAAN